MLVICGRVGFSHHDKRKIWNRKLFTIFFIFSLRYFWQRCLCKPKCRTGSWGGGAQLKSFNPQAARSAVTLVIWSTWMSWRQKVGLINISQGFRDSSGVRSGCLKPLVKCNKDPAKRAISTLYENMTERARGGHHKGHYHHHIITGEGWDKKVHWQGPNIDGRKSLDRCADMEENGCRQSIALPLR